MWILECFWKFFPLYYSENVCLRGSHVLTKCYARHVLMHDWLSTITMSYTPLQVWSDLQNCLIDLLRDCLVYQVNTMFIWNNFYFNLLFKPDHGWVPATPVMGLCVPNGPSNQKKVEVIHAICYNVFLLINFR